MPVITKIFYKESSDKYWIYIDNDYCTSVRARTFKAMDLEVGREITCPELKELENHHFKHQYGQKSWQQEKVRIDKVKEIIESVSPNLSVSIVGFGADSDEFIPQHPDESGAPDLAVVNNDTGSIVMRVEVTGTEAMRGSDYWVRPDKLTYCQNHSDENVWIVLHYQKPTEKFVFIKPDPTKEYTHKVINIRNTDEHYVIFNDTSPEVKPEEQFRQELLLN
ncbi:hypothetical protein [Kangiella koreensis]|uniref:Uncharacterized protein n=1 Tax=Kangiella koreensis (strain DSM 16069 / JCM 12317 / KCTC 12182 / SW-125) TaxID=523791 RepID=C7R638_KANKD|nr:hypothetical protein [Kangiella koreensis]ACV25469.1 hypothetical protein Kkor_0047 [Kangiella koreensis DSM 16069]